jgi:hypothetical protein
MHATIASMTPPTVALTPTAKRHLTPPNLTPEEKAERWARLARSIEKERAYKAAYAAGRRYEKRRLLKLLGK